MLSNALRAKSAFKPSVFPIFSIIFPDSDRKTPHFRAFFSRARPFSCILPADALYFHRIHASSGGNHAQGAAQLHFPRSRPLFPPRDGAHDGRFRTPERKGDHLPRGRRHRPRRARRPQIRVEDDKARYLLSHHGVCGARHGHRAAARPPPLSSHPGLPRRADGAASFENHLCAPHLGGRAARSARDALARLPRGGRLPHGAHSHLERDVGEVRPQ